MIRRREFMKQIGVGSIGLATFQYLPGCDRKAKENVTGLFTPESQGVSSQGLIEFFDAVNKSELEFHSIMINRNGKTILEGWWNPFQKEHIHSLYSLSKSFTSTAIGMLHDEGKLDVATPVISFFPDKLPAVVSENLANMKIFDLLTMHTGHDQDTMDRVRTSGELDWVKAFLNLEVPRPPGSHFFYNTGATYMLSAIVSHLSDQNVMNYLKPRLFDPLGIVGADWEEDLQGINVGGYGLRIRTEDILNFGQLYLQKGEWNGKQLLSSDWISEATKKQVDSQDNDSDWGQGYGYQFWMCKPGCFRGDGAYGQYCIVVPEKNAVIAITSESKDMGASMQLVWDHILPAMQDGPKPENPASDEALTRQSTQLNLPIIENSSAENRQNDIHSHRYVFDANDFKAESISFNFANEICETVFMENGKRIPVTSSLLKWNTSDNKKEGNTLFPIRRRTPMPTRFSSYYFWKDPETLVMKLKYIENAHTDIFTFSISEKGLELSFNNSLSLFKNDPDERAPIKAQLAG